LQCLRTRGSKSCAGVSSRFLFERFGRCRQQKEAMLREAQKGASADHQINSQTTFAGSSSKHTEGHESLTLMSLLRAMLTSALF
jgi:hypothetical protein